MLPNSKNRATARAAVLHLTHEVAEWLSHGPAGEPSYSRVAVAGEGAAELASAAAQARDAAGAKHPRCVLALGGRLVDQRVIELPELARGDLRNVLARKAAHALEAELADTLYAALPLGQSEQAGADAPKSHRWFLMSTRKATLRSIELECRRHGLELTAVTSAPLARLCEAQRERGDIEQACIVVDVDLDSVVVSLVQGTTLRHQNRIAGTFASVSTMALALVQELKTFDAFWRRSSRGTGVTQVVVLGLDLDRSRLFATAVGAALPEARVTNLPIDGESLATSIPRADIPRVTSLAPCGAGGPFALELKLALPPRPRTLVAVGSAVALVATLAGVTMKKSFTEELESLQSRRRGIETLSAQLESLETENRETERQMGTLQLEVDRLVRTRDLGIDVTPSLRAVRSAVEAVGELRSMSFERFAGSGSVRFSGRVPNDPVESIEALKAIQVAIERDPRFENVQIELATFRETDHANDGQEFSGTAEWEQQP